MSNDLGWFFDNLISKSAEHSLKKLNKPLTDEQANLVVSVFNNIEMGSPDKEEIEELEKLGVPRALVVFGGFFMGQPVPVNDIELRTEMLGESGLILYYREAEEEDYSNLPPSIRPQPAEEVILGYNDYLEEKIYLADFHEITSAGLFGGMYAFLMSDAGRKALQQMISNVKGEEGEEEDSNVIADPTLDSFSFLSLPEKKRTFLTYYHWVVHLHEGRQVQLVDKLDALRFEVSMRRQFLSEDEKNGKP